MPYIPDALCSIAKRIKARTQSEHMY